MAVVPRPRWTAKQIASLGAAVLYGTVAVAMGFVNKAVLMDYKYSNTVLTLQMAVSAIICYALRWTGLLFFRPLNLRTAWTLVPLVFFYNANVGFALAGLRTLNIPMYNVLKRMTPVIVLAAKVVTTSKVPATQVTLSVLTTVAGCLVAGLGDLSFDPAGYSLAMMSCVLQATYLLLVEKSGGEKGLTSTELLVYNSVLSFPVLLFLILVTGEAKVAIPDLFTLGNHSKWFLPNLFVSSVMGVFLNYTLFLCTLVNSALTTTIIGVLKGVVSTLLGFVLLGGMEPHFLNCLGIFMNMAGGVWYTACKFQGRSRNKSGHPLGGGSGTPTASSSIRYTPSLASPASSYASFEPLLAEEDKAPLIPPQKANDVSLTVSMAALQLEQAVHQPSQERHPTEGHFPIVIGGENVPPMSPNARNRTTRRHDAYEKSRYKE